MVVGFEIMRGESSDFVLPFQDGFGYLGSREVRMNFRVNFSVSQNHLAGAWVGMASNLSVTRCSVDLNHVESPGPPSAMFPRGCELSTPVSNVLLIYCPLG